MLTNEAGEVRADERRMLSFGKLYLMCFRKAVVFQILREVSSREALCTD